MKKYIISMVWGKCFGRGNDKDEYFTAKDWEDMKEELFSFFCDENDWETPEDINDMVVADYIYDNDIYDYKATIQPELEKRFSNLWLWKSDSPINNKNFYYPTYYIVTYNYDDVMSPDTKGSFVYDCDNNEFALSEENGNLIFEGFKYGQNTSTLMFKRLEGRELTPLGEALFDSWYNQYHFEDFLSDNGISGLSVDMDRDEFFSVLFNDKKYTKDSTIGHDIFGD